MAYDPAACATVAQAWIERCDMVKGGKGGGKSGGGKKGGGKSGGGGKKGGNTGKGGKMGGKATGKAC